MNFQTVPNVMITSYAKFRTTNAFFSVLKMSNFVAANLDLWTKLILLCHLKKMLLKRIESLRKLTASVLLDLHSATRGSVKVVILMCEKRKMWPTTKNFSKHLIARIIG